MHKKLGVILSVSALIITLSIGCQRPTDLTFSNLHCTEARMETDVNAKVEGDALNIKVCVQCAGSPAEGAVVEGHLLKTESFDPPESVGGHMVFDTITSQDSGCTSKDLSISGIQPADLVGQKVELTVKDIKGKVADSGEWQIRSAESN